MIKDKIRQTKDNISEVQKAQKALSQSNTYSEFYESLKVFNFAVKNFFEVYTILVTHDKEKFCNLEFKDIIEKIDAMTVCLEAGDILRKSQIANFVQLLGQQENCLKKQWEDYVIGKSLGVLNTLRSIKGLFDDKIKIQNMILRLENAKNKWPVDLNYIKGFEKDVDDGKMLIQEVNASQEVQRFLTLVSMEQATVNDISEEILKWINERKFDTKIRLSFIS